MAKRNCRMTPEERSTHERAVRLRKMTDAQLVAAFDSAGGKAPPPDTRLERLIEGLAAGEVKGIRGATLYKVVEYAKERGLVR